MKKSNGSKKQLPSTTKRLLVVLSIMLVLTLIILAAWWFLLVQNIAESVTVEAGSDTVDANAYLLRDWDIPASFASDISAIDLNRPGDYPVRLSYYGRVYDSLLKVRDTVQPAASLISLTTLSIETPAPEDFVLATQDVTQVSVAYAAEPDMSREGDQTVSLLLTDEGGNTTRLDATLTVIFDRLAPAIGGVEPLSIFLGQEPDYLANVMIADDLDEEPVLTVDDSQVDLTRGGEYPITYVGRDASGNEERQETTLTIIVDETAPSILGVNPISLYAGSTVSYRSGILVTDDLDDSPKLSIDSSAVDLSQPGTYEVTYKAVDKAGNESSVTTTVTVKEKTAYYTDEETICAAADEILEKIITEEMTDREKVEAVYKWVTGHYSYYGASDKTDWMQAAYTILRTHMGDCFNFYAVSKLMLDRLGIPNITVTRAQNPYRSTSHYWSLVSVDGGENYYHFDTTPHSAGYGYRFCLVTDEYLDNYDNLYCRGYYARDPELYPATPTEPLE